MTGRASFWTATRQHNFDQLSPWRRASFPVAETGSAETKLIIAGTL